MTTVAVHQFQQEHGVQRPAGNEHRIVPVEPRAEADIDREQDEAGQGEKPELDQPQHAAHHDRRHGVPAVLRGDRARNVVQRVLSALVVAAVIEGAHRLQIEAA